jgi:spore coat-associated protein N
VPLLGHSGRQGRPGRVLASGVLLAAAVAVTALGLFAGFASASPLGRVSAHRPKLTVKPHALARVGGLAPGDRAERTLELRYRGRFAAIVLKTRTSGSSLLRSNATGLRLVVERCSKRWTKKHGTRSYVCRGKRWSVLKTVRVSGKRKLRLKHLSRRAGRTDHLRLTVSLPRSAGNTSQGQTARVAYRLIGIAAG